jgi:hypothetical protein
MQIETGEKPIVIPDGLDGEQAVRLAVEIVRARTVERLAPLAVSVIFILAASYLITFSSHDGGPLVSILAASLFVVGLGLGGFAYARLALPGFDLNVSSKPPEGEPKGERRGRR